MSNGSSSGISFAGLLTIAFIVLKLCHVIDWSWIWVLSPIWISFGIGLLWGIGIIGAAIGAIILAALFG